MRRKETDTFNWDSITIEKYHELQDILNDEEDDKKSENGEKNLVNDKENAKKKGSDE